MPITSFSLRFPSEMIFGSNALSNIPNRLQTFNRVLILVSASATKSVAYTRLIEQLKENNQDIFLAVGIDAEAPLNEVNRWIRYARECEAEAIVAIGGGAVLDAAKVVAAIAPSKQTLGSLFTGKTQLKEKGLFFMAVPSTAGSGSECTQNAVLLDPKTNTKKSIRSPFMIPDIAVIDPDFTLSCPESVTAYSGLDALTQAIESYLSKNANPISQEQALDAIRLLMANLKHATSHGSDPLYRSPVALGSMLSGMAFSQTGLGAIHAFAHPIGAQHNIPHGLICAALLIDVLELNFDVIETKLDHIAVACGLGHNATGFIKALKSLLSDLEIPSIKELGVTIEDIDFIIENCRSNSMNNNPRSLTDAQIKKFFTTLLS